MGKATAKVGRKVIAESDTYETVDGNIYVNLSASDASTAVTCMLIESQFPPSSIDQSVMTKSSTTTGCPYKGTAHYYTIKADGKRSLCKRED